MIPPQVPTTLFFFIIASVINIGIGSRSLVDKGLFTGDGRTSLYKLRRALASATSDADKQAVLRPRRWYIFHLLLFWTGIVAAFLAVAPGHP
jgi:hypothetical protein